MSYVNVLLDSLEPVHVSYALQCRRLSILQCILQQLGLQEMAIVDGSADIYTFLNPSCKNYLYLKVKIRFCANALIFANPMT